jgi:hypothetical protein
MKPAAMKPAAVEAAAVATAAVATAPVTTAVPASAGLGLTGPEEQGGRSYGCRSDKRCEFVEHDYLTSLRADEFRWTARPDRPTV